MRFLRTNLLITDLGFLVYWSVTALHLLPPAWLFKDYDSPILTAWNWSFLPLDLSASALGLTTVWLLRRNHPAWRATALIALTLTFCAGLMALSFWTLRQDFDWTWWLPNLYLMLWPLAALRKLIS